MPRYYFDIRDQNGVQFDDVGIDLPDIATARKEARLALAEILAENLARDGRGAVTIDIRAGDGKFVVEVVAATDERDRLRS